MSFAGTITTGANNDFHFDDVPTGVGPDRFTGNAYVGDVPWRGAKRVELLMEAPLNFVAVTIVVALFAGTLRSVRLNLIRRPAVQIRPFSIAAIGTLEFLLWVGCAFGLVAAAPHPITIVLLALIFVSVLTAGTLRYREEKRSINRWIQLTTVTGCSLADLLESLANSCHSRITLRAKACIKRLNRGESIEDSVRRAKLPLDGDTLAAILIPSPSGEVVADSRSITLPIESQFALEQDSQRTRSFAALQFAYVVVTMILAWVIGTLVRRSIVPMFEEFIDEFDFQRDHTHDVLEAVVLFGNIFMTLLLVWLLLACLVRWLPLWMVRLVPWFGRNAIDQWRSDVLEILGRGMQAGQADSQILQNASRTSSTRWVRVRCRSAFQSIDGGTQLPMSMRLAKIITASELVWLTCADNNAALPQAISKLCSDIRRRQTQRWRIRMSWFVPLSTVLVGLYVLTHAGFLFDYLAGLIRRLS